MPTFIASECSASLILAASSDLRKLSALDSVLPNCWPEASWESSGGNNYPTFKFLVNGLLVGGCVTHLIDDQEGEILRFFIALEYQKQGLGKLFLQFLLKELKWKKIFLEVAGSNFAAQKLYQEFAFKKIYLRKSYYCSNEDAFVMLREEFCSSSS